MKGWQRVGVAVSVLWLIGVPIYLMVDANGIAAAVYQTCIRSADLAFEPGGFEGNNPDELKVAERRCSRTFYSTRTSPEKLMRLLLGKEGDDTLIVWAIILLPIILFWLVAGATVGTIRWIRRTGAA